MNYKSFLFSLFSFASTLRLFGGVMFVSPTSSAIWGLTCVSLISSYGATEQRHSVMLDVVAHGYVFSVMTNSVC